MKYLIIILLLLLTMNIFSNEYIQNLKQNNLIDIKSFNTGISFNTVGILCNISSIPMIALGGFYITKTEFNPIKIVLSIGCCLMSIGLIFDIMSIFFYYDSFKPLYDFYKKIKNKYQLKGKYIPNINFGIKLDYIGE